MIYELLTTALLAVSLNNNPKRENNVSYPSYTFSVAFHPNTGSCYGETTEGPQKSFNIGNQDEANLDLGAYGSSVVVYFGGEDIGVDDSYFDLDFSGFSVQPSVTFDNQSFTLKTYQGDSSYGFTFKLTGNEAYDFWNNNVQGELDLSFSFSYTAPVTYSVNKTFNNCHDSGNTDYRVPDSFTASSLSNPYKIYVIANEGYFFKRDDSSYSFSSGVIVSSVDYGANPTAPNVPYTEMMIITFSMPVDNVTMTFNAIPISLTEVDGLYNQGYQDARNIYENTNQFVWLKSIWSGMATFFSIEVLPNISLGFLCFSPLIIVAIVAIVRIIKHD